MVPCRSGHPPGRVRLLRGAGHGISAEGDPVVLCGCGVRGSWNLCAVCGGEHRPLKDAEKEKKFLLK